MIAFDLDHFKTVNDRWGHAAGDAVLRAAIERHTVRHRDIDIRCTASLGIVVELFQDGKYEAAESLDELLNRADKALFDAKQAGRNQLSTIT